MKKEEKALWLPGILCLTVLMSGCDGEKKTSASPTRAPQREKKITEGKPVPEHPEIVAIREEIRAGAGKYDAIRRRLFSLPPELAARDASSLLDLLMQQKPALWTDLGWAAIVNDGFNVLRGLKTPLSPLPGRLLQCYRDESRPMVLRDYALQHVGLMLVSWYREGGRTQLLPDASLRAEMVTALKAAMKDGKTSLAGTAFNAVDGIIMACDVSGAAAPLAERDLDELGKVMATSPHASEHARISALGFLGRRRSDVAVREARLLMREETASVLLRAAAIHYLGMFGDPLDIPGFRQLASSEDVRLSCPSQDALKKSAQPSTQPS